MEMTVYQPSTNTIWEFWKMRKNISGGWEGCWGGRLQNASTSQGAFTSFYGTTATSLPFLGGQITREELQRGEIKHAIGMALVHAAPWSVVSYPAQRSDGDGKSIIPEGSRFRLDPNFDVDGSKMHPVAKIIAKAAQKYGFIVWDRAGSLSIRAANETTYTSQGIPTPYKDLFNGTANWAILNGFPWEKVQFLPMNYGKP